MRCLFMTAVAIFVTGCAANSGVAPIGPNTFMVSRQAASGFSGSGTLKAEALNEANQFCAARDKSMYALTWTEAAPPYVMGNFPKAEVQFMCLEPTDPRLKTPPQPSLPQRF